LIDRKYRTLFSSSGRPRKPGPKGPSAELIAAIVEMKRRNPKFGCLKIAQQIAHGFRLDIDKDVVRRVLAIDEIKSVPNVPVSHPFIERLTGTICRECLDRVFFWNTVDLTHKLNAFRDYYDAFRVHRSLDGTSPHNALALRHLNLFRLSITRGGSIAAVYS
jgi:hypothetical protein